MQYLNTIHELRKKKLSFSTIEMVQKNVHTYHKYDTQSGLRRRYGVLCGQIEMDVVVENFFLHDFDIY